MWDRISIRYPRVSSVLKHAVFPAFFYFAAFSVLTFPLMGKFFTDFFADRVDGLQNVWNIWWVNQVVRRPDLYPSIWYTRLLHWPLGTTLAGHTLNPFNGYLGVPLLSFLSLRSAYNIIVVFTFVMTGLTMQWLAYHLTRAFWASLVAGFIFTFSAYHFGHGGSQLQTASLEWIPLFLLCWVVLLTRPGLLVGLAAALSLWLVILCDYYYFTYCVLAAILLVAWYAAAQKSLRFIVRGDYLLPLGVFAAATLLLIGPMAARLLIGNARDPLIGAHDPSVYSMDLLALVVPGGNWRFSHWTEFYWSRLPGNVMENSVALALPVFIMIGYLWSKRKALGPDTRRQLVLWSLVLSFFFLLALGPVLHVAGTAVWDQLMPYTLLGRVLPFLGLSGVPARMSVMVVLSAAVLSAFALRELFSRGSRTRLVTFALLGLLVFQTLPGPLVTIRPDVPSYVTALAALPNDGGALNLVKTPLGTQLYYQTIHGKPLAFGYLARVPASVVAADERLSAAIEAQDYARLWGLYGIRYIISSNPLQARADQPYISLELLYSRNGVRIYRLGCLCEAGQ